MDIDPRVGGRSGEVRVGGRSGEVNIVEVGIGGE